MIAELSSFLPPGWHDSLGDLVLVLTAVAVAVTVFKFPYRSFVRFLRGKETRKQKADSLLFDVLPELLERHDRLDAQVKVIVQELKPNHGASLRDAINRLEDRASENYGIIKAIMSRDHTPMMIMDEKENMVWANASFLSLVDKDSSEVYGSGYWNIVEPGDRARLKKETAETLADRRGGIHYFNVLTGDRDFPLASVESNSTPIFDKDGELTAYVVSLKRLDGHDRREGD